MTFTALETQDLVCIHIPFYAWLLKDGQVTPPSTLVDYLQRVDEHVIGALQQSYSTKNSHRMVVVCTPSPHQQMDGVSAMSPYLVFEGQKGQPEHPAGTFNEPQVANRPLRDATKLFERFAVNN